MNGSLWIDRSTSRGAVTPAREVPDRADVVVIGGGLAGMCTAAMCADSGASVVVLEATGVASRTTGHSTAKLTSLHGLTYSKLISGKGLETAVVYATAQQEALLRVRELVARHNIECDLVEASAFTCAGTKEGVDAIEREAEAARRAGLRVQVVHETGLPLHVECAVRLDDQAQFDPVAFCAQLAERLSAGTVTIVEQARVGTVDETSSACTVAGDGFEIACDAAVITTHLPIVDPSLLATRVKPERSYVVAGPTTAVVPHGMYIAHDSGWSIRHAGSGEDRVLLVGGEGHAMVDHVDGAEHYPALEQFARRELAVDVTHRWSAFDYATTDGVPFIGRLSPRSKRRYVATGFHKWGMTNSMVSASIISDLIAGKQNPYADTFDSTRIVPTITRNFARTAAQVTRRFVGDRVTVRLHGDQLPQPGQGVVTRNQGRSVAIARDADGTLHALEPVCTHMGCIVGFNSAEQTWDCPCHGSRFGLDGSVIDGPATTALTQVDLASNAATSNFSES